MTTADELAAVVVELRPLANDMALPDTCDVKRKGTATVDSRGNKTYPETTIATARCRLRAQLSRPEEKAVADQVEAIAPYAIDLPYTVALTAPDVLLVNGTRRFQIVGVIKEGGFGVFATAIVEERT